MVNAIGVCAWTLIFLAIRGKYAQLGRFGTNCNKFFVCIFFFSNYGAYVNWNAFTRGYNIYV